MKADRSGSHCRFATARPSGFLSGVAAAPRVLDPTDDRSLKTRGLTPPRSETDKRACAQRSRDRRQLCFVFIDQLEEQFFHVGLFVLFA